MTEAIDSARRLIESRLRELESESRQIEAALRSLNDGAAPRPPRSSKARTAKAAAKRRTKRAPRGRRRQQLLAALKEQPGATASHLAKQVGISTNQAYALASKLHKDGQLTKRGRGYYVVAATRSPKSGPAKTSTPKPRRAKPVKPSKRSPKGAAKKPRAGARRNLSGV